MNYSFSAGIRFELCMETRNINNRKSFFVLPLFGCLKDCRKRKKKLNASCMYIFPFIFWFCDRFERRMFFQVWTWEADFICVVVLSIQWFVFWRGEEEGDSIMLLLFSIVTNALVENLTTLQENNCILQLFFIIWYLYILKKLIHYLEICLKYFNSLFINIFYLFKIIN